LLVALLGRRWQAFGLFVGLVDGDALRAYPELLYELFIHRIEQGPAFWTIQNSSIGAGRRFGVAGQRFGVIGGC
jgi:hypothetical protein